jgi:DNA processing protein
VDEEITSERLLELSCWLALTYLRGIGRGTIHSIAARNRASDLPMSRFFEATERDLLTDYDLPAGAGIEMSHRQAALKIAKRLTSTVVQRGIAVVTIADTEYPAGLLDCLRQSAPPLLYVGNEISLLAKPGIAVVGTRDPSAKARRAARACAKAIAAEGFNIVSGYADGIDTLAHIAALKNGGTTTAVLPRGILRFRRKPRFPNPAGAETRVAIVSEFAPDALFSRHTALTRNRTICALANAVLVVETRERGGAINAGRNALRLGKPLFVAAGDTTRSTPAGNRLLITEGANRLTVFGKRDEPDLKPLFDAARSYRSTSELELEF